MIYVNHERATFKETNDQFTVRFTGNVEDACELVEVGFEYICEMEGKNCLENGSEKNGRKLI